MKNELVALLENLLSNKQNNKYFLRGDFEELMQLPFSAVKINLVDLLQTPGATNKARWTNKLL